jgi:diguanylate cyclase (GGDEF)-like protein
MLMKVLKKLAVLLPPMLAVAAAGAALPLFCRTDPSYAVYVVFGVGLFLSFHFNRGRAFFALLIVLVSWWSVQRFPSRPLATGISFLLPINLVLLSLMREKGIVTAAGRMRLLFLAVQAVVAGWVCRSALLTGPLLQLTPSAVPRHAGAVVAASMVVTALKSVRTGSPLDAAIFGMLWALALAGMKLGEGHASAVFTAAAGFIACMAILQDSHNMAFRDDLTGLPSRRALNESMSGLGRTFTVAMIDIDHFKNINDTYGHDFGDQVLRMVAARIKGKISGGKAFRYGGEEFAVIYPRRNIDDVVPGLEELRRDIADYRLRLREKNRPQKRSQGIKLRSGGTEGHSVSVTISIGVAGRDDRRKKVEEVFQSADRALYEAKDRGRNRLCVG